MRMECPLGRRISSCVSGTYPLPAEKLSTSAKVRSSAKNFGIRVGGADSKYVNSPFGWTSKLKIVLENCRKNSGWPTLSMIAMLPDRPEDGDKNRYPGSGLLYVRMLNGGKPVGRAVQAALGSTGGSLGAC